MLKNYLTIAIRNLLRHKGYSAINILGLAIGMACCVLILFYIQDERSYDRFHEQANQIYRVVNGTNASTPSALGPALAVTFPEVRQVVRLDPPSGSYMMRYRDKVFNETLVYLADSTLFQVFTLPLIAGDPHTAFNDPLSVVITQATAQKYFGHDNPMGQIIRADDAYDLRVTGVLKNLPPNSHFQADFFIPFRIQTFWGLSGNSWEDQAHYTYIVLPKGYPPSALKAKLPAFLEKYSRRPSASIARTLDLSMQPLTSIHLYSHLENEIGANGDIAYIYILAAIALFIILMACINYMNLATARAINRAKEVGVRKVLGANRVQLMTQFWGESLLVACLSLIVAIGIVELTLPLFNSLSGKTFSIAWLYRGATVWELLGLVVCVGVISGSYPALVLSAFHPVAVFKGRLQKGIGPAALRRGLVVVQFTVSIAFLIGTGVVYHQLDYIRQKRLGFNKEHVLVIPSSITAVFQKYGAFRQALSSNPQIVSMTMASTIPGRAGGKGPMRVFSVQPEGTLGTESIPVHHLGGDEEFLSTLGIELVAGRKFARAFADDRNNQSCILNETAVSQLGWSSPAAAIGKRITIPRWRWTNTVIGVVKDFHMTSLHQKIEPLMITLGGTTYIAIRTRPERVSMTINQIKQAWQRVYPGYSLIYSFLDDDVERLYTMEIKLSRLFSILTLLAILIACLGLFGLVALTVEQRTKEIGIRKVFGASVLQLVRLLSREFVILVLLANLIAWPVAYYAMSRWLQDFAYRIEIGVGTFVLAALLALGIALLTVSVHAIKTARANPVDALRYE